MPADAGFHSPHSRRIFLAGASALGLSTLANARSASATNLPGNAELANVLEGIIAKAGDRAELTLLGRSRNGRPITMLSIGKSDRSALVVGGPHPNEPIGGETVLRLARRLAEDHTLLDGLGYRWHFIGSIDPDGLAMNEGWFDAPRNLETYYRDFFRPALDRQPEYSFPLNAGSYRFERSTPENLAWQKALELTQPAYQVSLHSADYGGAFFLTDRVVPGLSDALLALPAKHGLTINAVGEPFSELIPLAPGHFQFPDLGAMVEQAGENAPQFWRAGDSSARFSAARYGTFNLVCEVPLWDDPALRDTSLSAYGMADILSRQIKRIATTIDRIDPAYRSLSGPGEQLELYHAIEEFVRMAPFQIEQLTKIRGMRDWTAKLPIADFVLQDSILAMATLRPLAMFARLAWERGATDITADATTWLASEIAKVDRAPHLKPPPLDTLVGLQIEAILTGARTLSVSGEQVGRR